MKDRGLGIRFRRCPRGATKSHNFFACADVERAGSQRDGCCRQLHRRGARVNGEGAEDARGRAVEQDGLT